MSNTLLVVVPNVNAFDQEENVFGDVGGVVGDAFQIANDGEQIESLIDLAGVALHKADQLVIAGGAHIVDGVIRSKDAAG